MNLAMVLLQRYGNESTPFTGGNGIVHWFIIAIAVIIGGGLCIWALTTAINNFVPDPWKAKLTAVMYIVVALILAILVFHWAGMY